MSCISRLLVQPLFKNMFGFLGWNSDSLYTYPWQVVVCSPKKTSLTVKVPCFEQEFGLETSRGSSQPTGFLWLCVGNWRVQLIHSQFRKSSSPLNFSYRNCLLVDLRFCFAFLFFPSFFSEQANPLKRVSSTGKTEHAFLLLPPS